MAISTITQIPRNSSRLENWLKDYCTNSTVAGCQIYVASGTGPKQRIAWLAVHVACLMGVVFMIVNATLTFAAIPTVTTPESSQYPIYNVDFPAVAICGINKINYSAAVEVAEDIMEHTDFENFTLNELTDMLKYLGHLYLFELNDREKDVVDLLHKLLIRRFKNYIPDILRKLAPSCRWILQYCSWGGREEACEDIFFTRKTGDGYCCTFNYARRTDDFSGTNPDAESLAFSGIERSQTTGSRFGLTVLLRSDLSDHHYKILPVLGYKILISPSFDFPDVPSGGVRQVLISPQTVSSVTLDATPFYSVPEVLRYNVATRGCLFNDEQSVIFGKYYSYSNCIMYCRITDILKSCDCVPFFYPKPSGAIVKVCDLRDLPCLREGRDRWMRVSPKPGRFGVPSEDISSDVPNSELNCTECFPACTDVLYEVAVNSVPLTCSRAHMGKNIYDLNDGHSIVHIYFTRPVTIRLKQDVLFYWYDLLSNYGGLFGLFLGVSIISVAELLYFFTLRLYNRKDGMKRGKNSRITFVKAAKPGLWPLYWNEMIQPNGKY